MAKQNTNVALVKFSRAKLTVAAEMTQAQHAIFAMGAALGAESAEQDHAWVDALKACKTPQDKLILRAGFVSEYAPARGCAEASAIQAFNRLAKAHRPDLSRKAKSNEAKAKGKPGPKEKTGAKVTSVSAKEGQYKLALEQLMVKFAERIREHTGDVQEQWGEVAAIAKKALK